MSKRFERWYAVSIANDGKCEIVAATVMHEIVDGIEKVVNAVLLSYYSHIDQQVGLAALQRSIRAAGSKVVKVRSVAHNDDFLALTASALESKTSLRFIGRNHHLRRTIRAALQPQQEFVQQLHTPLEFRLKKLRGQIVLV